MRRIAFLVLVVALLAGCGGERPPGQTDSDDRSEITVYCGCDERLIAPLLQSFTAQSGIAVKGRYGEGAEMTATLLGEGAYSGADLFASRDAAALGEVARAGMFVNLPDELLQRVPQRFRADSGEWIRFSGRARVVLYNTERVGVKELPQALEQFCDPRYRGRFGIAPGHASTRVQLALYRALEGDEALRDLLACIVANEPQRHTGNESIVAAVMAGEIDWGLVDHDHLWRALAEQPEAPAGTHYMPGGDASSFINIAGVGVVRESPQAIELVRFMLSDEGQRHFAAATYEYPAESLAPTLEAIDRSGLMQD